MGDIGQHFPPGDPQYKDISSITLLKKVRDMLKDNGWYVGNIDAVVVAEQPKLADYRGKICSELAKALNIPSGKVNVKASTSEELGFVGREEGVASWATVLLERESE